MTNNYPNNQERKWKTREEREREKAKVQKSKEEFNKSQAEIVKQMIKSNECPKCHKAQLRKFKRKNYTHGVKSKPYITTGKRCPQCNYSKTNNKNKQHTQK
jgi:Asp-tRNA(Asn)/Glu-tRNA(Gln) amidotransferase B subunit